MAVEMAIWRMEAGEPVPLRFQRLDLESRLEELICKDPGLVGLDVLVVGQQIPTAWGGYIDVLAVDGDGFVHVLELKRDKTPRDVVAQTLDYGSWAQHLTLDEVAELYANNHDDAFDDAFAERFDAALPDVFNADQQFTIVASELDPASERIVEYLAERYGLPINAVFFRHFADGDAEYLARTWLLAPEEAEKVRRSPGGKGRPWNGQDYYCVVGKDEHLRWDVCRKYGIVCAGGGRFHWETLKHLEPGKRVFAYVGGGGGYVGVGEVTGTMIPFKDVVIDGGGRLVDQPDVPEWQRQFAESDDPDTSEYAVPVRWLADVPLTQSVKEPGLFANQRTCRLKDTRTIETVTKAFGLDD